MSITILGAGTAANADLAAMAKQGEFRKATPNMLLAYAAIEAATRDCPLPPLSSKEDASTAMILGSSFGELDITQEFLATVAGSGVARPLLFQSSLHNATLGFLTLKLGITGPTLTISSGELTGERSLETAIALLSGGIAQYCLVVGVERQSPALAEPMALAGPQKDGAGALLLTLPQTCATGLARLESLSYETSSAGAASQSHSDAIERLAERILRDATTQAHVQAERALALRKSSGMGSLIRWSAACQA